MCVEGPVALSVSWFAVCISEAIGYIVWKVSKLEK